MCVCGVCVCVCLSVWCVYMCIMYVFTYVRKSMYVCIHVYTYVLASLAIYEDNFSASDNQYSTVHHLAINHSFPESPSTLVDTHIYTYMYLLAYYSNLLTY